MNPNNNVMDILVKWEEIKKELVLHFEKKDPKSALAPMEEGIVLFQNLLYWSNDLEYSKENPAVDLKWKPINVDERLAFIIKKPNLYHSFIQLSLLMEEQVKQYSKKMVLSKK